MDTKYVWEKKPSSEVVMKEKEISPDGRAELLEIGDWLVIYFGNIIIQNLKVCDKTMDNVSDLTLSADVYFCSKTNNCGSVKCMHMNAMNFLSSPPIKFSVSMSLHEWDRMSCEQLLRQRVEGKQNKTPLPIISRRRKVNMNQTLIRSSDTSLRTEGLPVVRQRVTREMLSVEIRHDRCSRPFCHAIIDRRTLRFHT
ncbi:hypothetical protein JOB18_037216 [Solea senegalensis]|uniref:Uncharacterized protein n=1 Tax=Solea senegalensis TaxID=28829 RepID=A0AAV6TAG5_SOLSE|nr:hypothetical protein JOB18_037216 [Solea senegalensis]